MTVQLEQPVRPTPPRDIVPTARRDPIDATVAGVLPLGPEAEEALKAPAGAWGY